MVLALTIVAVCLAFVCRVWWSVVAGILACLEVILMLVVALFHPRPGAARRYSFGLVHWAVAMSEWILTVATVHPRGGCRLLGTNERTLAYQIQEEDVGIDREWMREICVYQIL